MKAGLPPIGPARSLPAECRRLGDGGSDLNGYRYASGTQDYRELPLDFARGRPFDFAQDERALGWKTAHLRSA